MNPQTGTDRKSTFRPSILRASLLVTIAVAASAQPDELARQPRASGAAKAHNMRLVGMHDLQGRSSYQPVVHNYGGRWILFAGHHAGEALSPLSGEIEANGVSMVEVTDPKAPVLLDHLPATGEGVSGTQHVQVCGGTELPNADPQKIYMLRTNGQVSHEVWDITDPAEPNFVTTVTTTGHTIGGRRNTHKNWWNCETGIGYLLSSIDGWRVPRVLQAFDLGDPAHPVLIRNFALDPVLIRNFAGCSQAGERT